MQVYSMCTTFFLKNDAHRIVGKNMDVFYDIGYLFTNQRGITKTAFIQPPDQPLTWVSKYGSLTFNQIGKEFPLGGMNEQGLVVEQMTLLETQYPPTDDRPAITELQWIQYMLDTCCTVSEVLVAAEQIRIAQTTSVLHYIVCDRYGQMAILEFLEGNLVTYSGSELTVPVLANSKYKESLEYSSVEIVRQPKFSDDYKENSLQRFACASQMIQSFGLDSRLSVEDAFQVLHAVKRHDTVWTIVYNIANLSIHFFTNRQHEVKNISLMDFDYSKQQPSKALNIHCVRRGNLKDQFDDFNLSINKELAQLFFTNEIFTQVFQWNINQEIIDYFSNYPLLYTKTNYEIG
jgi:penicillin V acylase-like amidase (Ntn superfamily)